MIPEILTKCHNMYCLNLKRHYRTLFLSDCILPEPQRMNDWIFTVILQGISATEDSITLPEDPHIEKPGEFIFTLTVSWYELKYVEPVLHKTVKRVSLPLKRKYTYIKRDIELAIEYACP